MNATQPALPFDSSPPLASRRRKRNASTEATAQARADAFDKIKGKRGKRHLLILHAIAQHGPMTTRQVLRCLVAQGHLPPTAERNQVSPRLSEMAEAGCVEALDELRVVGDDTPATAWKITPRGQLLIEDSEPERN
ncbi:MAG: hypothetical protein V7641_5035 [Blastocatellia bacterium]